MNLLLLFRNIKVIHFYDVKNFKEMLHCCSVTPHLPGRLCTSSPTTLLYLDYTQKPCQVRALDCSSSTPKPAKNIIHVPQQSGIYDICCVTHNNKQLLYITHGYKGLFTYNTRTDQPDWNFTGNVPGMKKAIGPQGVTSDSNGHLFVCDVHNACIQLFSVTNGKYFGTYLMKGEEGLGTPRLIRWCRNTASLVVAHIDSNMVFNISRFQVNAKDLLEREKLYEDVIVLD